jgi:hypothetical protein
MIYRFGPRGKDKGTKAQRVGLVAQSSERISDAKFALGQYHKQSMTP